MTDPLQPPKPAAAKIAIGVALVLAIAAVVIELLVLFDRVPRVWGTIGGSLVVLAIAISLIGQWAAKRRDG